MPAIGVGKVAEVAIKLRCPPAATAKVLIWPLLDAIRKLPFGVAASDMPWQLSSVSPLAKGEPAIGVKEPEAGAICSTLIVWSPLLATNIKFLAPLTVIRSTAEHDTLAPTPPEEKGDPGTAVSNPPVSTTNAEMLFEVAVRLLT